MRTLWVALPSLLIIASCAADTTLVPSSYESISSVSLWLQHRVTHSPRELAIIEAELGTRGETNFQSDYLGIRTASSYGNIRYPRNSEITNSKNCSDFGGSASAQKFFLANGGPISDPHDLDRDGDGLACEWGIDISRVVQQYYYKPVPVRVNTYSSTCYTGPRGGRYTLTASGNKNYGGC